MHKWIFLIWLSVVMLLGCSKSRQHVYATYYGTINTDTMQGIKDDDGELFYIVKVEQLDSSTSSAAGLEGAYLVDFFKPANASYFRQMFGSDGGESDRIYYNPLEWEKYNKKVRIDEICADFSKDSLHPDVAKEWDDMNADGGYLLIRNAERNLDTIVNHTHIIFTVEP